MRHRRALLVSLWLALGAGCASNVDTIERAQRYYEDNQYERALALWRDLDRRGVELTPVERTRFAYFRGMTDYRLGFRDDARHWLAIAKASELDRTGALRPAWRERLDGALAELDRDASGLRPNGVDVVQTIELPATPPPPINPPATDTSRSPGDPPSPALPLDGEPGAAPEPAPPEQHGPGQHGSRQHGSQQHGSQQHGSQQSPPQ